MSRDERYDIVIIGGGPNGMTIAAYLAKCGLRVCVLEERPECGGACETQEPIPGVRIYPHAMLMYASPAPGFEQLELHKYGFRMSWDPMDISTPSIGARWPTGRLSAPAARSMRSSSTTAGPWVCVCGRTPRSGAGRSGRSV